MRVAKELGLSLESRSDLYYALLMKDAGCSTNASNMMQILGSDHLSGKADAARDWTRMGWAALQQALSQVKTGKPFLQRVRTLFELAVNQKKNTKIVNQMRSDRGASIARRIGLSEGTAEAIQNLNEHWNGLGQPNGLRKQQIPMLSRIMNLAQTVDVFYSIGGGAHTVAAEDIARSRKGQWFDPDVVNAFCSVASRGSFWADVEDAPRQAPELEPCVSFLKHDEETLDNICLAFADVIDAKSPFTYRHSTGVAGAAVAMARTLALDEDTVALIRRSALLHDIGKLGVPNTILDKPGPLTDAEWSIVYKHPYYSHEILRRVPCFSELSEIAASHHERLDGTGYFRGLTAAEMPLPARILAVADVYDALSAKRPYRDALPREAVMAILSKDVPRALDGTCFEALNCSVDAASDITAELLKLSSNIDGESLAARPARWAAA
jgi:putative nucleotidyltransferase with HDIG domain